MFTSRIFPLGGFQRMCRMTSMHDRSVCERAEAGCRTGEAISVGRHHRESVSWLLGFFRAAQERRAGHRGRDQAGVRLEKALR